jgi:hypothetical protein
MDLRELIVRILLVLLGIVGLGMSLCGGFSVVTIVGGSLMSGGWGNSAALSGAAMMAAIGLVFLAAGAAICVFVVRKFTQLDD